jgi:hypothetical protein
MMPTFIAKKNEPQIDTDAHGSSVLIRVHLWFPSVLVAVALVFGVARGAIAAADEPAAINPFGKRATQREDALPGCIELSDGTFHPGMIYLTRDKRLQIYDEKAQRQREVPLSAVKQIDCQVAREWMEKEWRFKETTSDVKMYTGRTYPSREYLHTITLRDGRTISGPLACIVYLQPQQSNEAREGKDAEPAEAERYFLNKRNKGDPGQTPAALVYVKQIRFGKDALAAGQGKATAKKKADPE